VGWREGIVPNIIVDGVKDIINVNIFEWYGGVVLSDVSLLIYKLGS